jgi:hypothetical protein
MRPKKKEKKKERVKRRSSETHVKLVVLSSS